MSYFKELGKKLRDHHKAIDNKVEKIEKYQKYVNTELDYAYLYSFNETPVSINANDIIIPTEGVGNMSFDLPQGCIELKANKVYKITATMNLVSGERINFALKNLTTDTRIGEDYGSIGLNVSWSNKDYVSVVPVGDEDMLVSIYCLELVGDACTYGAFTVTVQEINRQIVVDPVEYVNKESGIEDVPVGHIITYTGTIVPAHYLACDGTEYNINDYPYLAQHIEDNFNSINYFGGDGETTFAVPDFSKEGTAMLPTLTENNDNIISSGQWDSKEYNVFDNNPNTIWESNPSDTNGGWYIGYNFGVSTKIDYFSITSANKSEYDLTAAPISWEFQGSNDNGETWEVLGTYAESFTSKGETKYCTVANPKYYKAYRIYIVANNGALMSGSYWTRIGDIQFYSLLARQYIKYEPTYFMTRQNTNYLQPTMYSEEERVVGCWINGKPLYEKTMTIEKAITPNTITTICTLENIDDLIDVQGICYYHDGTNITELDIVPNSRAYFRVYPLENTLACCIEQLSVVLKHITVQYTKTTDAENSFTTDMIKDYTVQTGGSTETTEYTEEEVTNAVNELW